MLRPLNPRKDLLAIADLIELCFAETLDQSGREYIRQLRRIGKDASTFWIGRSTDHFYAPRQGFVWEEEGKIVGNLSIFSFQTPSGVEYLIANVAVHPDFRRRGIARLLTERALDYIHQQGGRRAWLNVRQDNLPAISLYRSLNFSERLRRTQWQYPNTSFTPQGQPPTLRFSPASLSIQIRRRKRADWQLHQHWLLSTYPPDYHWHLDFQIDWFAPGFFAWLRGFLSDTRYDHYSIVKNGALIGVATLQSNLNEGKTLWIACDAAWENEALQSFLNYLSNEHLLREKITLDYPAQRATEPLQAAGFTPVQTLIWMQHSIERPKHIAQKIPNSTPF
jgi:ribosomal protein S18 acetylase RimI-like enzyme